LNDFFVVARITSISGSEGFLNLQVITDFPENLFTLKEVFLDFFGSKKKFFVEEVKRSGKSYRIKFKKFDSVRELEVLVGRDIYIENTNVKDLPEGNYFIHDLIDVHVWQDNKILGVIREVLTLPANDVFVIKGENNNEVMIPFVLSFIEKLDIENKILILKPGVGQFDDED
jgi:16S rRNA processing protein RimM